VAGRASPRFLILFGRKLIAIPVLLRLAFLPLFILCLKPRIFTHDAIPIVLMAAMALSNGYLSSLLMMFGPTSVESHEMATAGTMMTFFLLLGITIGSNLGLLIDLVLKRINI